MKWTETFQRLFGDPADENGPLAEDVRGSLPGRLAPFVAAPPGTPAPGDRDPDGFPSTQVGSLGAEEARSTQADGLHRAEVSVDGESSEREPSDRGWEQRFGLPPQPSAIERVDPYRPLPNDRPGREELPWASLVKADREPIPPHEVESASPDSSFSVPRMELDSTQPVTAPVATDAVETDATPPRGPGVWFSADASRAGDLSRRDEADAMAAPGTALETRGPLPAHTRDRLEAVTGFAESLGLGYHLASAMERIAAGATKGSAGIGDLREAAWLIERYVAIVERRPIGADLHATSARLASVGEAIDGLRAIAAALAQEPGDAPTRERAAPSVEPLRDEPEPYGS